MFDRAADFLLFDASFRPPTSLLIELFKVAAAAELLALLVAVELLERRFDIGEDEADEGDDDDDEFDDDEDTSEIVGDGIDDE
jgi:hypothetical protein